MANLRPALKKLLFGSASLSRFRPVGLCDPQSSVSVWLHGCGAPFDVTASNVLTAAKPLTIGIGLGRQLEAATIGRRKLALKFQENGGRNRLLGEIHLRLIESIPIEEQWLHLFEARDSANYCLPKIWLLTRYGYFAWKEWRSKKNSIRNEIRIPFRQIRSHFVFYICPRPVALATVAAGEVANIFPVDLMGPIGGRAFSLALQQTSSAVPLLDQSRRVALSSVPMEHRSVARLLGQNHKRASADWINLPFATIASATFQLPIPKFALRVREMEIQMVRSVGEYRLFLARIIHDQVLADGLQFFLVHGFCEDLRADM